MNQHNSKQFNRNKESEKKNYISKPWWPTKKQKDNFSEILKLKQEKQKGNKSANKMEMYDK